MQRISTATRIIDKFGPDRHGFTDGGGPGGVSSTQLEGDWFDNAQEEIARAIELSGGTLGDPAEPDFRQLYEAIRRIAIDANPDLSNYVLRSGDTMTGNLALNVPTQAQIAYQASGGVPNQWWTGTRTPLADFFIYDGINGVGRLSITSAPAAQSAAAISEGFRRISAT